MIDALTDAVTAALEIERIGILIGAVFAAGLIRGFAGFGTAMVYMPFASTILSPVSAIITILIFDLFGI